MSGGKASVVASVHGLQHIQCFRTAHLANDDAVRTHTQAGADQTLNIDFLLSPEDAVALRVSSRTIFGIWVICSSAESSMVMIRSSCGI